MASRHSAFLRKFYKEIGSFRTSQISLPLSIIGTSNGGVRTYIVRGPGPQNILRGQVSWVGGFCSIHPVRNRGKKNYQLLFFAKICLERCCHQLKSPMNFAMLIDLPRWFGFLGREHVHPTCRMGSLGL